MTRAITGTYQSGVVLNNPTYGGVTEFHSGAYIPIGGAAYDAALLGSADYPWRATSTADDTGAVENGQLVFADADGVLQPADPHDFKERITGFQAGDVIDLSSEAIASFTYAKGKLTLRASGSTVACLSFAGRYTKADFQLTPDGTGGTEILFAAGAEFPARLGPGPALLWTVRA